MNPFDLRGPQFLAFYFLVSVVGLVVLYLAANGVLYGKQRALVSDARRHLRDPYLLAYLRGGAKELLLTVAFSLCHRKLLFHGETSVTANGGREALEAVSHPLEHAFLSQCTTARKLHEILQDKRLAATVENYVEPLRASGLAADAEELRRRWPAFVLVAGGLMAIGGLKIAIALARGHSHVIVLVLMILAVLVLSWTIYQSRSTVAGKRALRDQQTLFARLKGRVERLAISGATNEAVLVAAAFGLGAFPTVAFRLRRNCASRRVKYRRAPTADAVPAARAAVVVAVVAAGVAVADRTHRVGVGWRPDLAAGIFAHLDRIDVVEVIADNYFRASRRELDALRGLAEQVPVHLHGVGLGLASASPVNPERLDKLARLVEAVRPALWSEHLAFVRAAGVEIGHLAMPPRTARTVEQTVANVARARDIVGTSPALENIATLFDPPMSTLRESEWTAQILRASGAPMLLDLHNLYANAVNTGRDPLAGLLEFPLEHVVTVHLSGGVWLTHDDGEQRLLDDHLHSPPPAVYDLLRALVARTRGSLDVILERDGHYPSFGVMVAEMDDARAALGEQLEVRRRA